MGFEAVAEVGMEMVAEDAAATAVTDVAVSGVADAAMAGAADYAAGDALTYGALDASGYVATDYGIGEMGAVTAGDFSGYDAVGNIISGGSSYGADAAGPGYTYDMYGDVIPNSEAEATFAQQSGAQTAANLQNGLTAQGGLSPQQYQAMQGAMNSGMSPMDAAKKVLGNAATPSNLQKALGALATGAGTAAQRNAAGNAAKQLSGAATAAAGVQSNAITNAAGIQAGAATGAAKTLSDAALKAQGQREHGSELGAAGLSTAIGLGGQLQSQGALAAGDTLAAAALSGGQRLSAADLEAAGTVAGGYRDSAGQKVEGIQAGIGTAQNTLASQTAIQKPYSDAGTQALSELTAGMQPGGKFNRPFTMADAQNMDAYKFALDQGKMAINDASAAGGLQLSSANIQSLGKFAEGTAAQYEQQAFNQWMQQNNLTLNSLQNMVQTGQISTQQLTQSLAQAGVNIETAQQAIGSARAAGTLGASQATAAGIQGSASALTAGEEAAAKAKADAQKASANYIAGGVVGMAKPIADWQTHMGELGAEGTTQSANALAAGQVGAAGYTAGGITGAANATAGGIIGSGNAGAAGTVARGNITGSGISNIGNQIAGILTGPNSTSAATPLDPNRFNTSGPVAGSYRDPGVTNIPGSANAPNVPTIAVPEPVYSGVPNAIDQQQIPMSDGVDLPDFNSDQFNGFA